MSDPERDALVAGKKAAEERIGHLERQVRIDTEALKVELAESRDQIRALTRQAQDEADMVRVQESTISGLEAQIANDDGSGKMSDPERDALVAGQEGC